MKRNCEKRRKTKADENFFEDVKTNCLINYIKDESPKRSSCVHQMKNCAKTYNCTFRVKCGF